MKTTNITTVLLVTLFGSFFQPKPTLAADLRVTIENLKPDQGSLMMRIHDAKEAYDEAIGEIDALRRKVNGGQMDTIFTGLKPGNYVVSVFQDINGNGTLDTNFFGKPKEPYGFSRNARGMMGPPSFDSAAIEIGAEDQEISIWVE